jgi:hypothetical protein
MKKKHGKQANSSIGKTTAPKLIPSEKGIYPKDNNYFLPDLPEHFFALSDLLLLEPSNKQRVILLEQCLIKSQNIIALIRLYGAED